MSPVTCEPLSAVRFRPTATRRVGGGKSRDTWYRDVFTVALLVGAPLISWIVISHDLLNGASDAGRLLEYVGWVGGPPACVLLALAWSRFRR